MESSELPRSGAVWHHELPDNKELVVYPLLYGQAKLCYGTMRKRRVPAGGRPLTDEFEKGYTYGTVEQAIDAALGWFNHNEPPPGDWIKEE